MLSISRRRVPQGDERFCAKSRREHRARASRLWGMPYAVPGPVVAYWLITSASSDSLNGLVM